MIPYYANRLNNRGFTLIELLIVVSIIGILASTVLVSLSGARDNAKVVKTVAQLKEIEKALFLATIEENRDSYWTMPELGRTGYAVGLGFFMGIESGPGSTVSDFLSEGNTKWYNGVSLNYSNSTAAIAPPCSQLTYGVSLVLPHTQFTQDDLQKINKLIDGEEANPGCGKFTIRSGTASLYRLSRNPNTIEF